MAGNTTRSEASQSFFVYVRDRNTNVIRRVAIPGDVQIGLEGAPAELQLFGRLAISAETYTVDSSNKGTIGISNNDTVVAVSTPTAPLSGRVTVNLPSTPREGQLHFIKDSSGTAGTTPIDVIPPVGTTIDGQSTLTISDDYGSIALIWLDGSWRMLVAGLGSGGGGGGGVSSTLSFVTINPEASLSNERHLTGSSNILMTDLGAGSNVYFDLSPILGAGAGTFTYATVTVDAYGRVTAASTGAAPPSAAASYLTAQNEPGLPSRRVMSGGLGTTVTDNGAGTTFTFNIDPRVIPFLTGANVFGSPNTFNTGITGSLTQLPAGAGAYIIGLSGITVSTGSNGQVRIAGSGLMDVSASYVTIGNTGSLPNERALIAGPGIVINDYGPGSSVAVSSSIARPTALGQILFAASGSLDSFYPSLPLVNVDGYILTTDDGYLVVSSSV